MDITQPLCRGRMVRIGGNPSRWVDFRYERLPIFCYWCGKVDHDERDCIQWIQSKETLRSEDKQFGAWMRASPDRLQRPQLVITSKRSSVRSEVPTGGVDVDEGGAQTGHGTELAAADNGQTHVRAAVDPTRPETASTANPSLHGKEQIPSNPERSKFEDQLREIDAAIFDTATNLQDLQVPDPTPACEEIKEKIPDVPKINERENEQERSMDFQVGPTSEMDKIIMDVDTGLPTKNNIFMGQGLSQAQALFSIGPHNPSPLCETKMRKSRSPTQKKNKKGSNVTGKENAWPEGWGKNKRTDEPTKKVMNSEINEGSLKRKIRLPLDEILMREEVGKKQKIEGEVQALSKIMATQLGSAAAAGQPRREQ